MISHIFPIFPIFNQLKKTNITKQNHPGIAVVTPNVKKHPGTVELVFPLGDVSTSIE
jgi:hypothetical protein